MEKSYLPLFYIECQGTQSLFLCPYTPMWLTHIVKLFYSLVNIGKLPNGGYFHLNPGSRHWPNVLRLNLTRQILSGFPGLQESFGCLLDISLGRATGQVTTKKREDDSGQKQAKEKAETTALR